MNHAERKFADGERVVMKDDLDNIGTVLGMSGLAVMVQFSDRKMPSRIDPRYLLRAPEPRSDDVRCATCRVALSPEEFHPPSHPDEQLCNKCEAVVQEMRTNGEL